MTDIIGEFLTAYLHYSVAQRLFEDTCRQMVSTSKGSPEERQALVDETLRLAICVSDNIDDVEGMLQETVEFIKENEELEDLMDAIQLITNNLKEDRARANSYSNFITYRRIGSKERKPRRPQVANPFVPIVKEEEYEEDDEDITDDVTIEEIDCQPPTEDTSEEPQEDEHD